MLPGAYELERPRATFVKRAPTFLSQFAFSLVDGDNVVSRIRQHLPIELVYAGSRCGWFGLLSRAQRDRSEQHLVTTGDEGPRDLGKS